MAKAPLEEPARRFRGHEPAPRTSKAKRAVNISIDAEVLSMAKAMGINVSKVTEDALRTLTEGERARRFYEENRGNFDAHNAYVARHGTMSEALLGPDAFDDPAP